MFMAKMLVSVKPVVKRVVMPLARVIVITGRYWVQSALLNISSIVRVFQGKIGDDDG